MKAYVVVMLILTVIGLATLKRPEPLSILCYLALIGWGGWLLLS